jgi:hypothetical protein
MITNKRAEDTRSLKLSNYSIVRGRPNIHAMKIEMM